MIQPEQLVGDEWAEWYRLTPAQRWQESEKLWQIYLALAVILSAGYFWCAVRFARQLTAQRARQLFLASIIYLPLLLAAMVWDKLK